MTVDALGKPKKSPPAEEGELNPKTEIGSKVRAFGTTEALRTTGKTEFEKIRGDSLIRASGYFSVNSVVLSDSVVFRQVSVAQLPNPG